jgi:phosphohistidine swiveling domain-containing protein
MKKDLQKLSKANFIRKYGHLRPGTYDINSLNYKEGFNNYFNQKNFQKNVINKSPKIENKIKKPLKKLGIYNNVSELLKFIKESIAFREYSKFIFSKSIDYIFENLIKFGKRYNISREDLSYIKIDKVLNMYFNLSSHKTINNLKKHIDENKKEYFSNKNISLPDIIKSPRDLYVQVKKFDKINYISDKKIISKVINYNKNKKKNDYNGIICIENADPGYDFLFSKNIKGLVTKYGGLNSHMAIRCSELNLPALIGVGEKNFNKIIEHKSLNIDCITKKIELIN